MCFHSPLRIVKSLGFQLLHCYLANSVRFALEAAQEVGFGVAQKPLTWMPTWWLGFDRVGKSYETRLNQVLRAAMLRSASAVARR
jgi:hypothetical protein